MSTKTSDETACYCCQAKFAATEGYRLPDFAAPGHALACSPECVEIGSRLAGKCPVCGTTFRRAKTGRPRSFCEGRQCRDAKKYQDAADRIFEALGLPTRADLLDARERSISPETLRLLVEAAERDGSIVDKTMSADDVATIVAHAAEYAHEDNVRLRSDLARLAQAAENVADAHAQIETLSTLAVRQAAELRALRALVADDSEETANQ